MQSEQARSFTKKHRRYLAILSGGICCICGDELEGNFHADHITPYSKGGQTSLRNGQALCQTCNLKKGAKVMSGTPTLRDWQEKALNVVKRKWAKIDGAKPLIAACPGSGKTWFSVNAAVVAMSQMKAIDIVLVIAPTVNIKNQWKDTFDKTGFTAHGKADNESLRFRMDRNADIMEGRKAFCVTYSQVSKDYELFVEILRKYKTLLIADEIHHADESAVFGKAICALSDVATLRLSLSGTPFNTNGGSLAMCDSEVDIDQNGKAVRKSLPVFTYEYSRAISERVCRPVEFIKVLGKCESEYRSLTTDETYKKVIDLSKKNKTDSIGPLLEPEADFFKKMACEALKALEDVKTVDPRAAMLVVAKDISHGRRITQQIASICIQNENYRNMTIVEIYNDSDGAHERITQLERDHTDIIVTVKMISEGVDIKRLRVGLYATDYRTRMFFIQFVGRFIRWESRLDESQHARIIIPGHIDIIDYAREIEQMVDSAIIPEGEEGPSPGESDEKVLISKEISSGPDGVIFRGKQDEERNLARAFFKKYPSLIGKLSDYDAIQAAKDDNIDGSEHKEENTAYEQDWAASNERVARAIARELTPGGDSRQFGSKISLVQAAANKSVGIKRKDKMTSVEVLKKRYKFLSDLLKYIKAGNVWGESHVFK